MSKWTEDKCGYCEHTASDLDRYECPECLRTGCLSCMPEIGLTPCAGCVEQKEFEEKAGLRR